MRPELAEVAVDYLTEATEAWEGALLVDDVPRPAGSGPPEVRHAPRAWVEAILRGEDHPRHRLVRILSLTNLKLTGKVANHLFACPHLANLRLLRLDDNPKLPAAFFRNLANASLFANLTHLSLAMGDLGKNHAAAFANATHLRSITHLSLGSTRFGSADALAAFLGAPAWAKLQHLDHAYTSPGNAGLAALAANPAVAALRSLRWAPCDDGALLATLARRYAATLERLWLDNCRRLDVVPALTTTGLQRLTHLAVRYAPLDGSGVAALAQHPALQHLETLDLFHTGCDDEGAEALADPQAPATAGLRSLRLANNPVSDDALAGLLASPQLRDVVELDLSWTGFGPASAEVLCNEPFASLRRLNLYGTETTNAIIARLTAKGALPALEDLSTERRIPASVLRRFARR